MGKWCYTAYEDVVEHSRLNEGSNATAVEVLKFFCEINTIYIQDAAALIAKYPDRADHPMFKEVPVFASEQFETFKNTMQDLLEKEEPPLDANLEKVIPGMSQWQSVNYDAVTGLRNSVDALNSSIQTGFQQMKVKSNAQREESKKKLASAFVNVARELLKGKEDMMNENPVTKKRHVEGEAGSQPTAFAEAFAPTNAAATVPPAVNEAARRCASYRMTHKHKSLVDMWNEWHGLWQYEDKFGGISGHNKLYGRKWRSHLNDQQYSRTSRIIKAIEKHSESEGSIEEMDVWWKDSKCSLSNFVEELQITGLIPRKAARGAKKKTD